MPYPMQLTTQLGLVQSCQSYSLYITVTKRFSNIRQFSFKYSKFPALIISFSPKIVVGQEDCLRLSIYTPDLPVTQNQDKLPVIVWLFGKFITCLSHIYENILLKYVYKIIPLLLYER
jgi:hypothetical protein